MELIVSPKALLEAAITPDMLYSVGVMLKPEQEQELLGKLRLVLGRRVARAVSFLITPEERQQLMVLGKYATREAAQQWIDDHVPSFPDILRVEALLLKAELFTKAGEIQASNGQLGIPDWSEVVESAA